MRNREQQCQKRVKLSFIKRSGWWRGVLKCLGWARTLEACWAPSFAASTSDSSIERDGPTAEASSFWRAARRLAWRDRLASFPCAYGTAENILTRINVQAGERVLITGASGGVGSAAVQLAKRRGAEVIALAADAKAEIVRSLGASRVVPRDANLEALFGQEYFDAAVDIVGGSQFGAILNVLKRGGRYGVSGAISGPIVDLDLRILYLKDLRLIGCTVLEPDVFPNLVSYIERGEIRPIVAATYDLSDIVKAQEAFLTKQHVGKIVLSF